MRFIFFLLVPKTHSLDKANVARCGKLFGNRRRTCVCAVDHLLMLARELKTALGHIGVQLSKSRTAAPGASDAI